MYERPVLAAERLARRVCLAADVGHDEGVTRQLEHHAGAYFHQDYDLESPSVDSVIDLFREEESDASVAELLSEIDRLLVSRQSDRDLRELWVVNWGASYDPVDGGHDMRNWLTAVRERLSNGPS